MKLKILAVIDEHTRERLLLEVGTKFTAKGVAGALEGAIADYGVSELFRGDNGPSSFATGFASG